MSRLLNIKVTLTKICFPFFEGKAFISTIFLNHKLQQSIKIYELYCTFILSLSSFRCHRINLIFLLKSIRSSAGCVRVTVPLFLNFIAARHQSAGPLASIHACAVVTSVRRGRHIVHRVLCVPHEARILRMTRTRRVKNMKFSKQSKEGRCLFILMLKCLFISDKKALP